MKTIRKIVIYCSYGENLPVRLETESIQEAFNFAAAQTEPCTLLFFYNEPNTIVESDVYYPGVRTSEEKFINRLTN